MTEFDADRNDIIQRAIANGVSKMILPNVDMESIDALHNTIEQYPSKCFAAMGLHPTSVTEQYTHDLAAIRPLFDTHAYCAVGEIGIDLYWDKTFRNEQCMAFAEQIRWAQELNLPIIIHSREATQDTLEILAKYSGNFPTTPYAVCSTVSPEHPSRFPPYDKKWAISISASTASLLSRMLISTTSLQQ